MPSDHVIADQEAFLAAVASAVPHAEGGAIVTFGAEPTGPNTQYGYIEAKADQQLAGGAFPIACFHEKPNRATAAEYLATGRFYWNCGIFLARASTLLDEMRQFLPDTLDAITAALGTATTDGVFVRPAADEFVQAENISIDNAIMETTNRGVVVPVQMGWSDVGAWDAVWTLGDKDSAGNVLQGKAMAVDTRNSLLRSDGRALIAAIGVENMAVIASADAILVAPIDRASDVKELIGELGKHEPDLIALPPKVARPWGSYETVASGERFQVKHLIVDPGERLSLQSHVHRSEHWVVVRGSAEVTVGEEVSILQENQSTFIPAGVKHRLANPGKVPLELVEIQCGPYLGEDDIVRFDDEYGRAEKR
jgi:mannose-1-phosphate guanylyltransferase/mannose-6-phosphate isomerase